ncbi:MAG: octaprenyl diphosphate synthase [Steroidobacteraceae bacterium]
MSLPQIRALVAEDMRAVDEEIGRALASDVALVSRVAEHITAAGGKRLRPMIVLLIARACGYQGRQHISAAAFIEFIHTATLLHDDVVDHSTQRRGRATANEIFGNPASVLVGDFVYSRAFQMMAAIGSQRVMEIMADATNVIAEGEVLQLMNAGDPDTTEQRYFDVIHRKTAALFAAGAAVGAVLAGASDSLTDDLTAYGRHLGSAFQLIDDALDFQGDPIERGKNLGDDLAEGKPTLPMIHAMRCGSDAERDILRTAIQQGGLEHLDEILRAIESTGALKYTRDRAQTEADRAIARLAALAPGPYREALAALARFAVARSV